MAEVFIGLGSNINAENNMCSALQALTQLFDVQSISSLYESEAIGFDGPPFLNCVMVLHTALGVRELQQQLQQLERGHGAIQGAPKLSSRLLDIDILLYDQCVGDIEGVILPREEMTINAFVLWPMAEIAPLRCHPLLQQTYQDLWNNFDKKSQVIKQLSNI